MAMQSLDGDGDVGSVPGSALDATAVTVAGQCLRARAVTAGEGCSAAANCPQVWERSVLLFCVWPCHDAESLVDPCLSLLPDC